MNALLAMALVLLPASAADDAAHLQGIWRGTRQHDRYTVIFCDSVMIGMTGSSAANGAVVSDFQLGEKPGTIDITRADGGVQQGRYVIKDDVLTLMLGDVGKPRPGSTNHTPIKETDSTGRPVRKPPAYFRYVFNRKK